MSSVPRRGLGRGFEVLIGGAEPELGHIAVDQIHPNPKQPRRRFEGEAATGLAESIKAQGLLQPVVVRPRLEGGFELIAGERRWRAAREAGLATVPALVREADDRDSLLLALVENVAREDLSPVEEARGYAVLIDEFSLSLGDVAERVGKSKPTVSNRIRLLELPEDVLAMIARRELTEGHARAVLAVPDHDERRKLAKRIVREGLSVRAAERAARWAGREDEGASRHHGRPGARAPREDRLQARHRFRREGGDCGPARPAGRRGAARGARRGTRAARRRLERAVPQRVQPRCILMTGLWLQDIESLEAISGDEQTRDLFLRMAQMSQSGRIVPFLDELERDADLDDVTKVTLAEIATDETLPPRRRGLRLPHARAALAQARSEMGDPGFEPGTSALSERRSNQLS